MSLPSICLIICLACSPESRRTELFFGLSTPAGGTVTDPEFQHFLDTEVTPRFPGGYTVLAGRGHWRSQAGHPLEEPSRILLIYRPAGTGASEKIEAIRLAYKARFQQESVLRIDGKVRGDF